MTERTLSIVKPDAVRSGHIGDVMKTFEENDLKVVAARLEQLTLEKAREFYAVHSERPFYNDLVNFMISGPIFVSVLEGENAILKNRELMGATNPGEAAEGTIRKRFGASIDNNAVHGSDAPETAAQEIAHFFPSVQIFDYQRSN